MKQVITWIVSDAISNSRQSCPTNCGRLSSRLAKRFPRGTMCFEGGVRSDRGGMLVALVSRFGPDDPSLKQLHRLVRGLVLTSPRTWNPFTVRVSEPTIEAYNPRRLIELTRSDLPILPAYPDLALDQIEQAVKDGREEKVKIGALSPGTVCTPVELPTFPGDIRPGYVGDVVHGRIRLVIPGLTPQGQRYTFSEWLRPETKVLAHLLEEPKE